MTRRWRKQLKKVADFFVEMPFDAEVWPATILPFASQLSWKVRYPTSFRGCNMSLHMLWKDDSRMGGDSLRKLIFPSKALESLPGNMVWEILQVINRG